MSTRTSQGVPQEQGFNDDPLAQFSRLFCRFLQVVFSGFEKGNYKWTPDDNTTDIIISDQASIGRESIERRPAILVARGPAAFANISMNQLAGPLVGYSDVNTISEVKLNVDPQKGTERHTDLVSATMNYNCISSEGLEAQRIAWAAGYFTRTLKRSLLKAGLHRVGEDVSFGSESAPGAIVTPDANEIVMVTTTVPFFFQDTYTLGPKYKVLLNEVELALVSEIRGPATNAPEQTEPPLIIYGRPLQVQTLISMNSSVVAGPGQSRPKPLKR